MMSESKARELLGDGAPLSVAGLKGPPDRRDVSKRWLTGTVLTGITSCALIGFAFSAAFESSTRLTMPVEFNADVAEGPADTRQPAPDLKQSRIYNSVQYNQVSDRRRLVVPTLIKDGDSERVRALPFMHVKIPLDLAYSSEASYPDFNPMTVFAEEGAPVSVDTGLIYGANVDSEISLRSIDFPVGESPAGGALRLTDIEVEDIVRGQAPLLTDDSIRLSAIHYVDSNRFGAEGVDPSLLAALDVRITPENVSVAASDDAGAQQSLVEMVMDVEENETIATLFANHGMEGESAARMAEALGLLLNSDTVKAGQKIRIAAYTSDEQADLMRATLYDGKRHLLTVAVDDRDQYVPADEPEPLDLIADGESGDTAPQPRPAAAGKSTIYDAINRSVLAYGMNSTIARRIVRILASDLDMRAPISAGDSLEVLFSDPDENDQATDRTALLYVSAKIGTLDRKLYRFEADDGSVDFFNDEGRSARQFLLRNPVPTGVFRSGFGMRRHPILRYSKMHWGVDWAAPRGTPIISPGNGVVEKAGWASGYGKQTIIRHANGFETSYSHQTNFAKGIQPGAKVRQGQVIGYIGTTGLSTGPHLHYEMSVNGTKVDPMRVRLPEGKRLSQEELVAFARERDRINQLLDDRSNDRPLTLARNDN